MKRKRPARRGRPPASGVRRPRPARKRGPSSAARRKAAMRRLVRDAAQRRGTLRRARARRLRLAKTLPPPPPRRPSFAEASYRIDVAGPRGTVTVMLAGAPPFLFLDRFWAEIELDNGDVLSTPQGGLAAGPGYWQSDVLNGRLSIELSFRRSAQPAGLLLTAAVRNRGAEPVRVRRITPLKLVLARAPAGWPPAAEWRMLRMGYTFGGAHREDQDARNSALVDLAVDKAATRSWGCAAWRLAAPAAGALLGFTAGDRMLGWIDARKDREELELSASVETEGSTLGPGELLEAPPLYLGLHEDLRVALPAYGALCARQAGVKPRPVPTGWCSWYGLWKDGVSESAVLEHVRFLADRKADLPVGVIQVDDGWARSYGDWESTSARFPGGTRWLAERIREAGFTPGLWLAPFVAQASSRLFADHPDWMIQDDTGKPLAWDVEWAEPPEPWYALDGSHPEARAWLTRTFARLREEGYGYFKLDFLFLGLIRGERFRRVTRVEAFRQGLAAIRAGAGDAYLLGCTAPPAACAGLVDGMRASHDIHTRGDLWASFREAMRETHQRWWAHRSLWNTDHDALVLRGADGDREFPAEVTRALAASVGLSGGALFAGDPLPALPPDRVALLGEVLRGASPVAAVPIDLFDRADPRLLARPLGRDRFRVGVFNPAETARTVAVDLAALGLVRARVAVLPEGGRGRIARRRYLTPPVPARGVIELLVEGL